MHHIVVFFPKSLKSEQKQKLSDVLVRMATANVVPIIIARKPTAPLEEFTQDPFEEKLYELTKKIELQDTENQDVTVPEFVQPNINKQHKYQKRYTQNQMNKIYQKHNKIFLNRIKHK